MIMIKLSTGHLVWVRAEYMAEYVTKVAEPKEYELDPTKCDINLVEKVLLSTLL